MKSLPLLMTASISTRGMVGAMFSDAEREQMYISALKFYCGLLDVVPGLKIVFAENSGWDISALKESIPSCHYNEVEFISLDPNDFDISRGKGYNEVGIIDQAIKKSNFIRARGAFFKVTGRYPIYNIKYFLSKAARRFNKGYQLYADVKDHKIFDWIGNGWCGHAFECRLFAISTDLWNERISSNKEWLNDYEGNLLEGLMFDQLRSVDVKKSLRFRFEPRFGGIEGSDVNVSWQARDHSSLRSKVKLCIGNSVRVFLPWLWL